MIGNPWYLATLAAAEQLYSALYQFNKVGSLEITSTSLTFWQAIYASAATGTFSSSSSTFKDLTTALKSYADGYVAIVQKYTPTSGALAEEFDKSTGAPVSAVDLTWSYASFLTMAAARDDAPPASWGAASVSQVPSVCAASSVAGAYSASINTNWPDFQCTKAESVKVTFNILASTSLGQGIYIIGSITELGSWDVSKAVLLHSDMYTDSQPLWYGTMEIAAGTSLEYKYIRKESDGSVAWESESNRSYTVPSTCRISASLHDSWS